MRPAFTGNETAAAANAKTPFKTNSASIYKTEV
jgi:hypothetical protein